MFKKILVCSDGSACTLSAAKVAAQIAAHFQAETLILNVFDPAFLTAPTGMGVWGLAVGENVVDDYAASQRESVERQIAPLFADKGLSCRVVQEVGHPVGGIVHAAEREGVDLIVVGSRELCGLKEVFLGSVSNGVLHHAHCPVLIVRGEHVPNAANGFRRILLASDGSEGARKATDAAVALAKQFAVPLTVLNVIGTVPGWLAQEADNDPEDSIGSLDPDYYADRLLDDVRQVTLQSAGEGSVVCSFRQERGHRGESIVRFSDAQESDLILMGSRGQGGFAEMLLGSVSQYVAHHAGCPVLVVR